MADVNSVTISGEIVDDPRTFDNGPCVLRLKHTRSFRGKDGETKHIPNYFSIVAWGRTRDEAAATSQGQAVLVTGNLVQERYTDKTGTERYDVRVTAQTIQQLDQPTTVAVGQSSTLQNMDDFDDSLED